MNDPVFGILMVIGGMISVWMVLTFRWMHAFDDAGENWWAVYVPVYRTVSALRTVELSGHWAWLIFAWYALVLLLLPAATPEIQGARAAWLLPIPSILLQVALVRKQRQLFKHN